MSIAAAQADAFFREVQLRGEVWSICDELGFPTSTNASGETAMPFWSMESRALKVIDNVVSYREFKVERISLDKFIENWLTGLAKDGLFVGINWSGGKVMGYDMHPDEVAKRLNSSQA